MSAMAMTRTQRQKPRVPNEVIGMGVFLFTEIMLFAGLISAYLVLRSQFRIWPPVGQPRLPVAITSVNTLFLLASGYTIWRSLSAIAAGQLRATLHWLVATFALGTLFIVIQGVEWVRLLHFGLTATSNVYGALFYTLIGLHAIHVVAALTALAVIAVKTARGRYCAAHHAGLLAIRLFWWFVVGIWPVLYVLVYLW